MKTSRKWNAVVTLSVFFLICSAANAGSGRSVPVMTAFTVKLDQSLSAKTSANGAPFTASLKEPVEVDGQIMIPAGASAGGVMSKGSPNSAQMELNSIFVSGRSYRITTEPLTIGQKTSLAAGTTLTFRLMLSLNIAK